MRRARPIRFVVDPRDLPEICNMWTEYCSACAEPAIPPAAQRREAEFRTGSGAALQFDTALLVHALRLDEAADGQVTEQRRTLEGATVDARVSQLLRRNRLGRSVVEHDDRAGIGLPAFRRRPFAQPLRVRPLPRARRRT